jgi:enoyl-CoA hydratase
MVRTERDGDIATIWFDEGPVNTMNLQTLQAFCAEVDAVDADDAVRAVVLTGQGKAFSAGVDLKPVLDDGIDYVRPFLETLSQAILAPFRSSKPFVAAVNGHAIAGGALLAMACDRVLCTDDDRTRIGLNELAVGVPFPSAAIAIASRRTSTRLDEVVLDAELHTPERARSLGLVDELVRASELVASAHAEAARLAAVPTPTFARTKEQLHAATESWLTQVQDRWDADLADRWTSDEVQDAIRGFVERTLRR